MPSSGLQLAACLLFVGIAAPGASAQYRFDSFTTSNGLPQNTVAAITQTRDGYLWIGTYDGLVRYDGVRFTVFDKGNTPALRNTQFQSLWEDAAGVLWARTGGGLVRYKDGVFTDGGVTHGEAKPANQCQDRSGRTWIHTDTSLQYSDGTRIVPVDFGNAASLIRAVLCDREGNVWVGTNDRGLVRIGPDFLHSYAQAQGLAARVVYPLIEAPDGVILAGTDSTVARLSNGSFTLTALPHAARSFFVDRDQTLWIGGSPGLWTLKGGVLTDHGDLVTQRSIDAIIRDRSGAMWAGGPTGLVRIDASGSHVFGVADGLPAPNVSALFEDRAGRVWVGTIGGLARWDGARFHSFTTVDGLPGDRVRSLYEDASGALWIGTFDSGLSRYKDGRFTNYTTRTGLFANGVFAILEDARGWFWMSSNRGIFRVPRRQLEEVAAGTRTLVSSVAYGTDDGMRSVECNGGRQPAGIQARNGLLWFPTQDGIVSIDPARASSDAPPPPLAVESVLVDGASVPFRPGLRVAAGQREIEINYTAPSLFKAEHVQFRYVLAGLNPGWIDAGTRRTVHYSHLPPGHYTFHVDAANSEGIWNGTGAAIEMTVLPFFYQTTAFKIAVLVAMIGIGVGASTLRIRRLKAVKQQLVQRVAEATADLAAANRRLELLATIDDLTQLPNRRRFREFLEHEWQRGLREGTSLALLMLDVDFFKCYNDTHGHLAGDECLRRVAAVIGTRVQRPSDLAARYGGEEFAVILAGADEDGAVRVAQWIRTEIEGQLVPHGASSVSDYVTVSIGVGVMTPALGGSPERLIADADAALYRAKELGRNAVIGATPSGSAPLRV